MLRHEKIIRTNKASFRHCVEILPTISLVCEFEEFLIIDDSYREVVSLRSVLLFKFYTFCILKILRYVEYSIFIYLVNLENQNVELTIAKKSYLSNLQRTKLQLS